MWQRILENCVGETFCVSENSACMCQPSVYIFATILATYVQPLIDRAPFLKIWCQVNISTEHFFSLLRSFWILTPYSNLLCHMKISNHTFCPVSRLLIRSSVSSGYICGEMLIDTAFLFDYEPSSAHLSSFPTHILVVSPVLNFSSFFSLLLETMSRTLRNEDLWHVFPCQQSLFSVKEGNCTGSDWYVLDRPTWPSTCFFGVLVFTNSLSNFLAFSGSWC